MAGVRDFRDLVCWQLSHQLELEIFEWTDTAPAARDFRFRDQIRDSSASAPRNIAEGFGRFKPGPFANYLSYARASLMETQNHLINARDRKYLEEKRYSRLFNLTGAALRLTTNLMLSKQRQAQRERKGGRR